MKIIFVCHDNDSIKMVYDKVINSEQMFIIVVGDKPIEDDYLIHPKIMVANHYTNNNEDNKKLLTFTAWYLIVNNELFLKEDYLCILEYDIEFDNHLLEQLNETYYKYDIISFQSQDDCFDKDIDVNLLTQYLSQHNLPLLTTWWPTTNHCFRRDLLVEFVNFYYYTYKDMNDETNISFYHERIFSSYTNHLNRYIIQGLKHLGVYSHHCFTSKKYALCYDTKPDYIDQLIFTINSMSPETEIIRCKPSDVNNHILWKPIIIYELLKTMDKRSTLLYLENDSIFSTDYKNIYHNFTFIKSWNAGSKTIDENILKQMIELFNLQEYIVDDNFTLLNTDIILFDNKPQIIHIVKQWLDMCLYFSHKSIDIPNYIDIIFSLLIHIYSKN